MIEDGRIQCDLCPRFCRLHDGQRAFCFVRARKGDQIVSTTYGQSTQWVVEKLGPDVPWHFTAFHPDWRMRDVPPTPIGTLLRARVIAMKNGVRYAYVGNVPDPVGQATYCDACRAILIGRNGYEITACRLTTDGKCDRCGAACAGIFDPSPGEWGSISLPVALTAMTGAGKAVH